MIYFETSRLRFRDWKESDLAPFRQLNADEDVMRYFSKPLSALETDQFFSRIQTEFVECGFGFYAVEVKNTEGFIGFIGLHRAVFEADFTPCVEIGWRLKKEAWQKGYATEGATACLQYGFDTLGMNEVYSFTADINIPSKKVMMKTGMEFVKHFNYSKVDQESPLRKHVLYVKSSSREKLLRGETNGA